MSIACVFPGQGSQAKGMGGDLFDRFADWTDRADAALGYSIRELCREDPRGELGQTAFTQPALFVVNAMTWRARQEAGRPAPAYLAGHSLGEYNALTAAGVFDFEAGLELVRRRGELMAEALGGSMAAVIGLNPSRIEDVLAESDAGRRLDVANFNSFDQTVVAGRVEDLTAMKPAFERAGARAYLPLKVSAPFHSRYMHDAMSQFAEFLEGFTFEAPSIPVVSNVTAAPYDASAIRGTLASQIGNSVRWLDSVLFMIGQGVADFEEVGPGKVLAKLTTQIKERRGAPS